MLLVVSDITVLVNHRPGSTNKDGWPLLQGCGKAVNGLPSEHRKTPPVLDCGLDSDHMTPDGADSEELCPDRDADISPFHSALDPARYSVQNPTSPFSKCWVPDPAVCSDDILMSHEVCFNIFYHSFCSSIDKPPESNSITENGETIPQVAPEFWLFYNVKFALVEQQ